MEIWREEAQLDLLTITAKFLAHLIPLIKIRWKVTKNQKRGNLA